jgi:putative phosphoesterase
LRLAIISDTHGNLKGLRKAVGDIIAGNHIDLFIHLGDDYRDAEVFDEFGATYLRVPGVFSDYYVDRSVPNRVIHDIEGWRFLLTHTRRSHVNDLRKDLKPEALIAGKKVDVVLYGHSHIPEIAADNGILFVNPGHLKGDDKKGHDASYAILDIGEDEIGAALVEAGTGRPIKGLTYRRP